MALLYTGSGLHVPVSGGAPFSPIDLTPSLWIDPSDTTTMFQSNAGTTTVTADSVCGFAGDKSGNSRNLTSAANDTARPTWRDIGGLKYLDFDGVNDGIRRTTALNLYGSGTGNSIFMAVKSDPAVQTLLFGDTLTTDADPAYSLSADTTTRTTMIVSIHNDTTGGGGSEASVARTSAFDNTARVVGFTDSTTSITTYLDQTAGTPTGYTRAGTHSAADRISLGADFTVATLVNFKTFIYGIVVVPRVLNSTEISNLVTWLGAKAGLTI